MEKKQRGKNDGQANPAFQRSSPQYKNLVYWAKNYAAGGSMPDKKAVEVFMECETTELVVALRAELIGITKGNFREDYMDANVGRGRAMKHGTYQAWAKIMLLWMAETKR